MISSLKDSSIWKKIVENLAQIDTDNLVNNYLETCNYQVTNRWEGVEFYEEITFIKPLRATIDSFGFLVSSSPNLRQIEIRFLLKPYLSKSEVNLESELEEEIALLGLTLDENLEIVGEKWFHIDVDSSFVIAKEKI